MTMNIIMKSMTILASVLILASLAYADEAPAVETGTLAVGSTGIFCVKAPCPWRGIVAAGDDASETRKPMWSGQTLPTLQASDADARLLTRAWDDHECLLVEGRFDGETLVVNGIAGPCR